MEATQLTSMIERDMPDGLIVLRSLGKFFGLGGARVGFLAAHAKLRAALRSELGPWTVSGPSREVAQNALRDQAWQAQMQQRILRDGARLAQLLRDSGLPPHGGCGLFQWVMTEHARSLHESLARRGILTRYFAEPCSLRFGLPGREDDWLRLQDALVEERAT